MNRLYYGDNLDILVMVNEPTFSGCLIQARVIGLFRMVDRGQHDFKILERCKSLEKQVDEECEEILTPQRRLFE